MTPNPHIDLTPDDVERIRDFYDRVEISALCDAALRGIAASVDDASMADKRDAERYRWLRDEAKKSRGYNEPFVWMCDNNGMPLEEHVENMLCGGRLDRAVDAAMSAERGKGNG